MANPKTPEKNGRPVRVRVDDGSKPLPREDRRKVVVDVLATAMIDILLAERARVRERHEGTTP